MEGNRLQIRRLRAEYLVPGQHPSPESVKDRLDKALTSQLASTLSSAFSPWFSKTDPSIWLIRRINIDVAVNASWDAEQLTRAVTTQMSHTLGANLQDSGDQNNVIRFSSFAAYLSRFLSDLAAGDAWGRWYYESFAGLRLLPTSTALRTAVCDQPETGREALAQLPPLELNQVLRALTRQDARLVLDSLAEAFPPGDEFDCRQTAWRAWQTVEGDIFNGLEKWGQSLYLYLTAAREQENAGLNLKDAILVRSPPTSVNEVTELLGTRQAKAESATSPTRNTSFGGAFLLLPLLDELPLAEATRDWPQADEAASLSLVRFLLLIKCAGQHQTNRLFYDPLLRDLLLIRPAVSIKALGDWQSQITAKHLQSFLQVLISWQRTRGVVIEEKQILVRTGLRGRQLIVLVDGVRGLWLLLQRYSVSRSHRLIDRLRSFLSPLESNDGLLLCDPLLLETLWPAFSGLRMVSLADTATALLEKDQIDHVLPRLEGLSDDLSHLALPNSFKVSPSLDLTLSVAAQHLLRAFAWRLPGFAGSNPPYLSRNFLDFTASCEDETVRRVVRLGRPPLQLILGVTGMIRQTYILSWLDQRPFALFQES